MAVSGEGFLLVSVAAVAARWIDRQQLVEVDLGDGLRLFSQLVSSYVNLVRCGIASPDEGRLAVNLDPRGGNADRLQATAVGGRPEGTGDDAGDRPPSLNGSGRLNGSATAGAA
jgi:hypothetical protein